LEGLGYLLLELLLEWLLEWLLELGQEWE